MLRWGQNKVPQRAIDSCQNQTPLTLEPGERSPQRRLVRFRGLGLFEGFRSIIAGNCRWSLSRLRGGTVALMFSSDELQHGLAAVAFRAHAAILECRIHWKRAARGREEKARF